MRGAVEPGRWRSASPGRGGGAAGATRAMVPPRSGPSNGAPGAGATLPSSAPLYRVRVSDPVSHAVKKTGAPGAAARTTSTADRASPATAEPGRLPAATRARPCAPSARRGTRRALSTSPDSACSLMIPCFVFGRLAIIRATVSGARVRSCQSRRQTGAPGTAVGPDDVDGRPGEPGNGGAGAPTSRNAARPCAPSARRGARGGPLPQPVMLGPQRRRRRRQIRTGAVVSVARIFPCQLFTRSRMRRQPLKVGRVAASAAVVRIETVESSPSPPPFRSALIRSHHRRRASSSRVGPSQLARISFGTVGYPAQTLSRCHARKSARGTKREGNRIFRPA